MNHTYSNIYGLTTTGLRIFTAYGPWDRPDMAYYKFTKAILNNKPINVFNHGNMVRDFTYIDDIVEGVKRVIENPPTSASFLEPRVSEGGTTDAALSKPHKTNLERQHKTQNPSTSPNVPYKLYNIGNSSPVQLLDFIKAIEKTLGKKAKMNILPMQPGDVPKTHSDVTDLVNDLGYKPDTPIQKGIDEFIEWYLSTNYTN